MIHISDSDRRPYLSQLGFIPLTGEACGLGIRSLCDIQAKGQKLLAEVLGLVSLTSAEAWNHEPGTVGSVMIPSALFTTLIVFGLFANPSVIAVYVTNEGVTGLENEAEVQQLDESEWVEVEQRYTRKTAGTSADGMRCVHQFTGRVV